jgi:hypothetical protein
MCALVRHVRKRTAKTVDEGVFMVGDARKFGRDEGEHLAGLGQSGKSILCLRGHVVSMRKYV